MDDFGDSFDSSHDSHDLHHDNGRGFLGGFVGGSFRDAGQGGLLAVVLVVVGVLAMIAVVAGLSPGSAAEERDPSPVLSDSELGELINESIRSNADGGIETVPNGGRSQR